MVRMTVISLLASSVLSASAPVAAQDGSEWDQARAALVASDAGPMADAISRWQMLTVNSRLGFDDHASFIMTYPGFPDQDKLRSYAEGQVANGYVDNDRLISFFDRYPPLTNPARAQYALALSARGRPQAFDVARAAWRGGSMSATAEATLASQFGARFTQDDQDARMNALLWNRDTEAASRQLANTSPQKRPAFMARLAAAQGLDPASLASQMQMQSAMSDPGYVYNIVLQLHKSGRMLDAANILATRPALTSPPLDQSAWVKELLAVAKAGGARAA